MRHFKSKSFHLAWLLAIILAVAAIFYVHKHYASTADTSPIDTGHISPVLTDETPTSTSESIPKSLQLLVPFTPQAPTANWDTLHNEACEEASAIMAHAYFESSTESTLKPEYVEGELSKITDWETTNFGYYLDINSEETVKLLTDFYGLNAKILRNYTETDLKKELTDGHVILFPSNGKLLGNPNFRSPGPPYHMLVLKGYSGNQFITNDPGTRKGLNYPYSYSTLLKANGNFDHETHEVNTNDKNVIVVWKEKAE